MRLATRRQPFPTIRTGSRAPPVTNRENSNWDSRSGSNVYRSGGSRGAGRPVGVRRAPLDLRADAMKLSFLALAIVLGFFSTLPTAQMRVIPLDDIEGHVALGLAIRHLRNPGIFMPQT